MYDLQKVQKSSKIAQKRRLSENFDTRTCGQDLFSSTSMHFCKSYPKLVHGKMEQHLAHSRTKQMKHVNGLIVAPRTQLFYYIALQRKRRIMWNN